MLSILTESDFNMVADQVIATLKYIAPKLWMIKKRGKINDSDI